MKIKLNKIKLDPNIRSLRSVNDVFVSRYRQAMRNGDTFPPLIIDQDNCLISGYHRYASYDQEFGENHIVDVERRKYASDADRVEDAVRDNAKHGNPLDGISRKRAILKLTELGRDAQSIARLLGISSKRVEDLAGMSVVVVGKTGRSSQPVKHGMEHMAGREVTQSDYEDHRTRDRGVPAKQQAEQLTRWLIAGWVDVTDPATVDAMSILRTEIEKRI